MNEFSCHGFHKDLPKGKASGRISVSRIGFEYQIANKQGVIPFEGAVLELGGASNRLVFIKHAHFPDWSIYTSDLNLLDHPEIKAHPQLNRYRKKARRSRRLAWSLVAAVLFFIVAAPIALVMNMDQVAKVIVSQIPTDWESQLAQSSMAQYQLNEDLYDQTQAEQLLGPLVAPLLDALEHSPYDYHFYIVNDSSLNAFALPGGHIVIHTGLILKADSAAELLGVVGHEIAHVTERHGLRNLVSSAGVYVTVSALLGDVGGLMAAVASAAPVLLNMSYSRKFETEADIQGHMLLVKAKVDPRGFSQFFAKLLAEEAERAEQIENEQTREVLEFTLAYLSTHPDTETRMQRLQEMNKGIEGDFLDLQAEFNQLQQAISDYVTEYNSQEDVPNEG